MPGRPCQEQYLFRTRKPATTASWLCWDRLIDEVGENERHQLASLMEILSVLIERYETEHVPELREIR